MGSSLVLARVPESDLPMSPQRTSQRLRVSSSHELKVHGNDPNEMMMVMLAVHAAELGQGERGR